MTRPDHAVFSPPRLPDGQRAAVRWSVAMVGAVGAVALVWLSVEAAATALATAAVGASLMLHAFRQSGLGRFAPCNRVTLARLGVAALLTGLLALGAVPDGLAWTALALALAALLLDGIDGWLARRGHDSSAFGARFDMEVDAALIAILAMLAWSLGKAGPWVLALGMMRYAFVAAAWVWPWLGAPLPHSHRRRVTCGVQVVVLAALLAPILTPPLSVWLAAGALLTLTASFAVDVLWLWRHRPLARPVA